MRVVAPGAGEVIGDDPSRRVELLCTQDPVHATVSRFAPGRLGADLHVHRAHHDIFCVLEGELTVRLGLDDERLVVAAGSLAHVPPGVVHGFLNGGDAPLRYLNLHAPGSGFADYLRGLRDGVTVVYDQFEPPADGGRPITDVTVGDALAVDAVAVERADGPLDRGAYYWVLSGECRIDGLAAPAGSWIDVPAQHVARGDVLRITAAQLAAT